MPASRRNSPRAARRRDESITTAQTIGNRPRPEAYGRGTVAGRHYLLPMPPAVSVVVVAFDSGDELLECVESVFEHGDGAEVVVVVNGDAHGTAAKLAGRAGVVLVDAGGNRGFAGGCNLGAGRAAGDVLLFLNPDAVVLPGAVAALARAAGEPGVGLVMPRLRLRA